MPQLTCLKYNSTTENGDKNGDPTRTRTWNLLLRRQLLYPLSYGTRIRLQRYRQLNSQSHVSAVNE